MFHIINLSFGLTRYFVINPLFLLTSMPKLEVFYLSTTLLFQKPGVVVTVLCDLGIKYLTKVYSPDWLEQNGIQLSNKD